MATVALSGIITPTNVVTATSTTTLSNKTISGASNTISNIPLSTGVIGTLPVANGGTGETSYTNGQLLIGNTTGNTLTKSTLTAGTGISITNGTGSITIANTATASQWTTTGSDIFYTTGMVLVGKTASGSVTAGVQIEKEGTVGASRTSEICFFANRISTDGDLFHFRQDNINEGTISVSGTTVSYNGGHLARWSQLPDNSKDETILKGTVLSNLNDMCVWTKDGETLQNEQLNKMKVSDVDGDTNVAGVFVNWTRDEDCNSDDMNVAMTGDMIIRIAQDITVQRGDLLMSAGDGTAKPQGDDIIRSKTVAKVTSNHITCTYADGSYCVPCVLMAC